MFDKETDRQNSYRRHFFAAMAKRVFSVVILALMLANIVMWGSVAVFGTAKGDKIHLKLAEDGYYEISTAKEYMEFWQTVQQKDICARGRLMKDITLNDPADYWNWNSKEPANKCPEVEFFFGTFDGNGHTVYGLYSDTGYGLVERNRGQIINLSIKDSMVFNENSEEVGGICRQNHRLIRNCDFGGEIYSDREYYYLKRLGGICGRNTDTVDMCGFSGKMLIKGLSTDAVAGICGKNEGEITNCYNLADLSDTPELVNRFYVIADQGESKCLGIKGSGWKHAGSGQVVMVDKEQKERIRELIHKDLYSLLVKKEWVEEWPGIIRRSGLRWDMGRKLGDPFPGTLDQILRQEDEKERAVREVLDSEKISTLIWEALWNGEGGWESWELDAEVSAELVSLQLSNQAESVLINIRPATVVRDPVKQDVADGSRWEELEALWQRCGSILFGSGTEDYERFSWYMEDEAQDKIPEKFILYQTEEGKQGFFWETEEGLYQIEADGGQEKGYLPDIQEVKAQIKWISSEREWEESDWEKPESGMYETMLWKLWDGHMPVKGIGWDNRAIRDAVFWELPGEVGIPAWEEVQDREELSVSLVNQEQVGTLSDLKKLPHLKKLSFFGDGETKTEIVFDVEKDMVPELEELAISNVDLEDLTFLKDLPQLKNLYVTYCGLEDLSGIECQKELRDVSFYQNKLSDISPLENCKKLDGLSLAYNELKDISVLASLPELSGVGIQGNKISDITPLQGLAKLTGVNLNENQISDLSPLKNLTELTVLGAAYNQISDISPLEGLVKLDNLALDYNEIQDIHVIENMPGIQYLGLSNNQIQDFTPVMDLPQLLFFRMGENPAQDIGDLVFLPKLEIESSFQEDEDQQQEAQEILDRFCPDKEFIAQDMVKGDLNGDGVTDLAIMGGADPEDAGVDDMREIYPLIRQADGSYQPLASIATLGPYSGGVYGDPYGGMLISDGRLVVKVYGGSSWRWGYTDIYEYENGEMKEKWELSIEERTTEPGYDFTVLDKEDGSYRSYVAAGEWEGESRLFLIAENSGELSPVEKEFEQKYAKYQEETGVMLTEFPLGVGYPDLCENSYDYQIHDQLYDTKRLPAEILMEAAEKYLATYQEIPLPYYTSEEILENYKTLTGVDLPEFFLIGSGSNGDGTKILAYEGCGQKEDGSYEHCLTQWAISKNEASFERYIYYDEGDGMFSVG